MAPVSLHPLFSGGPRSSLPGIVIDRLLVERIRVSFELIRSNGHKLAAAFYRRLFERQPRLRAMFTQPLEIQQQKLFASLETIVRFLEEPASQRSYLRELGARHAEYGARPEHYDIVIETLLEAIDESLGGRLEPIIANEWHQVLRLVSDFMLDGDPAHHAHDGGPPTL